MKFIIYPKFIKMEVEFDPYTIKQKSRILLGNEIYEIIDTKHFPTGKCGGTWQTRFLLSMRNIVSNVELNAVYRVGDKIKVILTE